MNDAHLQSEIHLCFDIPMSRRKKLSSFREKVCHVNLVTLHGSEALIDRAG